MNTDKRRSQNLILSVFICVYLWPIFLRITSIMRNSIWMVLIAVPALAQSPEISAERIRAHDRFLASDLLEGRGVGQRGGDLATEYIATQFELAGAKPARAIPPSPPPPGTRRSTLNGSTISSASPRPSRPTRNSKRRPSSPATASPRPNTSGTTSKVSTSRASCSLSSPTNRPPQI